MFLASLSGLLSYISFSFDTIVETNYNNILRYFLKEGY